MLNLNEIDNSYTLFLDRDGVINHETFPNYINTWNEFKFYDGVKTAIKIFNEKLNRTIVVTNQRGVAKGITKEDAVQLIHKNMIAEIAQVGGKIDAVYYCPELESPNRKPNAGMGLQAAKDFTDIDLSKSIMVGNTLSDMDFGRNIGAKTVFLTTNRPDVNTNDYRIDAVYPSLIAFALDL
jgi:D-glycero-D-manno-heptose 1,7-bisphosphate phosphatase